jgi:hypothetical protein
MSSTIELERPTYFDEQVFRKTKADTCIEVSEKKLLLDACKDCSCELETGSGKSIEASFNDFSGPRVSSGSSISLSDTIELGRVFSLTDFAERISHQLGGIFPKELILEHFEIIGRFRDATDAEKFDTGEFFDEYIWPATEIMISGPSLCWVFHAGRETSRELSENAPSLPCRLGLGTHRRSLSSGSSVKYIGVVLQFCKLADARNSTVFHGDYDSVKHDWEPGGVTEPCHAGNQSYRNLKGLNEVVCAQPSFSDVMRDIVVFEI